MSLRIYLSKLPLSKVVLLLIVVLLSNHCFGQAKEICNNGVDDDNDGYIDGADSECGGGEICTGSRTTVYVEDFGAGPASQLFATYFLSNFTGSATNTFPKGGKTQYLAWDPNPAVHPGFLFPNDDYYSVANKIAAGNNYRWVTDKLDHTPNDPVGTEGYALVVNASIAKGREFFSVAIDKLCGNTIYDFSAYISNVLEFESIKPNVTFQVFDPAGKLIAGYNTGDIAIGFNWKQYGFRFKTSPSTSSIVIKMINNAPGGDGNDLVMDDITLTTCGPGLNLTGIQSGTCPNTSISLTATVDNTVGNSTINTPEYQWQFSEDSLSWADIAGANLKTYTGTQVGYYRVIVGEKGSISNEKCRTISQPKRLIALGGPNPSFISTNETCDTKGSITISELNKNETYVVEYTKDGSSPIKQTLTSDDNGKIELEKLDAGTYTPITVTNSAKCSGKNNAPIIIKATTTVTITPTFTIVNQTCLKKGSITIASLEINKEYTIEWTIRGIKQEEKFTSDATGTIQLKELAAGVYNPLVVSTILANGCKGVSSNRQTISSDNNGPKISAGPDKWFKKGKGPVILEATSGGNYSYTWEPPTGLTFTNNDTLKPMANPEHTTVYTLIATDEQGCIDSSSVKVVVQDKIYLPNAFTPNGDGTNDLYMPLNVDGVSSLYFGVYNRYGQLIFRTNQLHKGWDGKLNGELQNSGGYAYVVNAIYLDGSTEKLRGIVILIR